MQIADGYNLAEAPVAADDGGVVFSDVLGGGVYRWSPDGGVEPVVPKRRGIGGMARHSGGGLVVTGRDVSLVADGATAVLYADDSAAGFNDLTVDPDGRVIVGVLRFRPFHGEEPVPGEFVRIEADGTATVVIEGVLWPNGCAFSPDGGVLYACDYHRGVVLAADRRADGTYGAPRVAVEAPGGQADGMAVDEEGGLWVALGARATVGRFDAGGALFEEIEIPAAFVASLCFGGADGRDLFVTTAEAVHRIRSEVAGASVTLPA